MLCIVASTDLRANGFTGPLSKCLDCFAILRGGFTAIDIMSVPQCVCVCGCLCVKCTLITPRLRIE